MEQSNNTQNQQQAPVSGSSPVQPEPIQNLNPKDDTGSKAGPLIGSIIVIIIIIVGGLYFWSTLIDEKQEEIQGQEESAQSEDNGRVDGVPQRNEGDETFVEIENELNTADLDSLDAELDDIDAEFENL